jgi:hypothetical protein
MFENWIVTQFDLCDFQYDHVSFHPTVDDRALRIYFNLLTSLPILIVLFLDYNEVRPHLKLAIIRGRIVY